MNGSLALAPLAHADPDAVEALLDRAFGADRKARTAYRLREQAIALPELSLAACDSHVLVGSLQCWPVVLASTHGAAVPMVLVGPVAIEPARQGQGIGRAMMHAMLAAADAGAAPHADLLMMVGDPDYYAQFGFSARDTAGWRLPGPWEPHRLLARAGGARGCGLAGMLHPA